MSHSVAASRAARSSRPTLRSWAYPRVSRAERIFVRKQALSDASARTDKPLLRTGALEDGRCQPFGQSAKASRDRIRDIKKRTESDDARPHGFALLAASSHFKPTL